MRSLLVGLACAAATWTACHRPEAPAVSSHVAPRLILVIAIDQLIPGRLDPGLPGGLGRIAREGHVFTDAAHAHALTATCPGHVVMLTGLHPGRAGIPGNTFILPVRGTDGRPGLEVKYCVQDDTPDGRLLTADVGAGAPVLDAALATGRGRSPRLLEHETLGDWMKARWPDARVFSVSAKDRAAIALGGRRPDVAYWLDRAGSGAFTTSRYYIDQMPDWAQAWTRDRVLGGLPESWDYAGVEFRPGVRDDDYVHEVDRFRRTEPHPLTSGDPPEPSIAALEVSPLLDVRTLAFADDLVAHEGLGVDETPDLLAISLSATDIVGHHYGPESREAWAALVVLDAELGLFIDRLETRVGHGRLLIVLTSDHGVLPIPEWWQGHGGIAAACPVATGRIAPAPVDAALAEGLASRFGDDWRKGFVRDGFSVAFDPALAARDGLDVDTLTAAVRPALESVAGIERVWARSELVASDSGDPDAVLYRNSLARDRGGDVFIQPASGCLFTSWRAGTSHGSPYIYDRAVPLAFWGDGIEPARTPGAAAPVDVAPTLADWIGLTAPVGLDGRVLPLSAPSARWP